MAAPVMVKKTTVGTTARDIEKDKRNRMKQFKDDTNTIQLQRYKRKKKLQRQMRIDQERQDRERSQNRRTATNV